MDRERVCGCQFKDTCQTFNDPLIDAKQKTADGHGCVEQSDFYRAKHCQVFRCAYLVTVVSDALGSAPT